MSLFFLIDKFQALWKGQQRWWILRNILQLISMKTSSMELNLVCNNNDYLEIAVGYKKPTYSLLNTNNPEKDKRTKLLFFTKLFLRLIPLNN
jgi:hypothetical protein